ncbi:hypothetical protein ACVWWG_001307 [Bradyrhizobium sp. LB7.2]
MMYLKNFRERPYTGRPERGKGSYSLQQELLRMPRSPSIVPHVDHDTYLVLNDFGRFGRAWCEADEKDSDRASLLRRLLEDQYSHPVQIVAFNTAEG